MVTYPDGAARRSAPPPTPNLTSPYVYSHAKLRTCGPKTEHECVRTGVTPGRPTILRRYSQVWTDSVMPTWRRRKKT